MLAQIKFLSLIPIICFTLLSCGSTAQTKKEKTKAKTTAKAMQSDIVSVSYKHTVGRGGFSNIEITKDLVTTESAGGMFTNYPKVNRKTTVDEWNKLISLINIPTLENIKSGEGQGHYDGPDEFITIKTKTKEINILNASNAQLTSIKEQLNKIVGAPVQK